MADNTLIDGLIKFCDEKSQNIELKSEPQVFVEIKQALEELKERRKGIVATFKFSKEDMQKIVDKKVAQIELDIQKIKADVIDEFAEEIRTICYKCPIGTDADTNEPLYGHKDGTWHNLLDDVAEQMNLQGRY